MILIITSSFDETTNYLLRKHDYFKKNSFRLNVDRLHEYRINVYGKTWDIHYNGKTITDCDAESIYYRKPSMPDISEYEPKYQGMIQRDIIAMINGIADSFEGTVLSKPYLLRRAENKIFQLVYAGNNDWLIPRSYIGNSNHECEIRARETSIIKPISTGLIKQQDSVEIYHTNVFQNFTDDISLTPVYIQEYIEKQFEVRLTVVGDSIFPVRIDTLDKLDWRKDYENHQYKIIECPKSIKTKCIKMLNDFELSFGAFDFIVTPDGEWVFLEVNPNGQWLWLEKKLDINISGKILEILRRDGKKNTCC